jgi:lipid-A-disaccharide synthase
MKKEGAVLVKHYKELAFMGFTEVILNLRTILKNIDFCKTDISKFKPDAVILVDYPGFNLRIAEFVKGTGLPVYYYISPQVWAWKSSRVKKIKRIVDRMFVILPFEKDFYKKFDYDVEYVGHPLPEVIEKKKKMFSDREGFLKKYGLGNKPLIALLPGSRKQEIEKMLPLMLSVKSSFPEYNFVIAGAPSQPDELYHTFSDEQTKIVFDNTYELLFHSEAALVTSGTATLETALLNVPEVVCYKGGQISYYIARSLVKIKFISLVNLIMDREVVRELIQNDLNTKMLVSELKKILDPVVRLKIRMDYGTLRKKLSEGGAASKTARLILEDLSKRKS